MKKLLLIVLLTLGLISSVVAENDITYNSALSAYLNNDYQKAFGEFLVLGKTENKKAQGWLGFMYEKGKGVDQDYNQAMIWYQMAADQGDSFAQYQLGKMYNKGKGVDQDYKQAMIWYQKAADQGDSYAQNSLGWMYQKGNGVVQDYKQAVIWYQKAADQGDSYAQANLANMYEYGKGVDQDYKQAVIWYQKAADQGHTYAQTSLGYRYEKGSGVVQDYKQAVIWYQKAADQGDSFAQTALGKMHEYGKGFTKDYKQAVIWYQKAADQGDSYAQYYLGRMYKNGSGVTKDFEQTVAWYQKAADQGHIKANQELPALELLINHNNKKSYSSFLNFNKSKPNKSSTVKIPSNAFKSGNTWYCKSGYEKTGNNCSKIVSNSIVIDSKPLITDYAFELEFWKSVRKIDNPDEYRIYLEEYPEGKFVALANNRINDDDDSLSDINYGDFYALVIGIDKYRHIVPLSNAVNDAEDVASLLQSKYQFKVNLLIDATREEILNALNDLRMTINSKDNILIYYAGHGKLDEDNNEAYWLPIDAKANNNVHWISNHTIISSIKAMKAKHVIVVADSCFSGTLTRGDIKDTRPDYLEEIIKKKSRTVLTSGGDEPVSDGGGGNNSVFAASFLSVLNENKGVLEGSQLFTSIRQQVVPNSEQTPRYNHISKAGHAGGDFLFVRQRLD